MSQKILELISFQISGRFAHFRKFYTNASSLSYYIPPRTVIAGVLASILKCKRDSYYELFHPTAMKTSVAPSMNFSSKKRMQSVNYLHEKYFKYLSKGTGDAKNLNMHSQCKLELLLPENQTIRYTVYVGAATPESQKTLTNIREKIAGRDFGYGLYLGQRQFRAEIDCLESIPLGDIEFLPTAEYTDTLCLQSNAEPDPTDNRNSATHIVIDQMPIHLEREIHGGKGKKQAGRIAHSVKRVLHERTGMRLFGKFQNGYRIGQRVITFYEG